jgi:hypothetical protein
MIRYAFSEKASQESLETLKKAGNSVSRDGLLPFFAVRSGPRPCGIAESAEKTGTPATSPARKKRP